MDKILLVSDMHIDKNKTSDFQDNWREMLGVCNECKIKDIAIGGDVFQSRSAQTLDVLMTVRKCLEDACVVLDSITIANGNHDKVDGMSEMGYNQVFDGLMGKVSVVRRSSKIVLQDGKDKCNLYIASYYPEKSFETEVLDGIKAEMDESETNYLYAHEGVKGGLSTESESEMPAQPFSAFDKVLLGHYHDRKKVNASNIEYIGASRQYNFGENDDKGYTILYADGETEFVKNCVNPRYKTVDISADDLEDGIEEIKKTAKDPRNRILANVHCPSARAVVDKQALFDAGASKVEIVLDDAEVRETLQNQTRYDKEGIKTEYVKFCDERKTDCDLGIKYLNKLEEAGVCGI